MHIYTCACWAVVIYSQWLYTVLEHSRSPSPHKMISHHIDDLIIQALCSGLLIITEFFFSQKNVPEVFWGVWGAPRPHPGVARGRKTIHFFL